MLHRWSPRAEHPMLRLHCASLRDTLLESELFGHERGAFTGAVAAKPGLLETADGGTVFLDEVGDIPLEMQVKLLRVIEERAVLRIGALKPRRIDVRFVAATHRPLERDVAEGRFRQDLYFRLAGVQVEIPALRERRREIPGLARVFAVAAAQAANRTWPPSFTDEALNLLETWSWPGNVRELRNTIERAVFLCNDGVIDVEHLAELAPNSLARRARLERTRPLKDEVADVEREHILKVLDECGGNQTQAARRLGISRSTLNGRLDAYQVPRPRKRL
jgi:two-component system response regulator AtoC